MPYTVPSALVSGAQSIAPSVQQATSYTNVAAAGVVTLTLSTSYNQILDIWLFSTAAGTLAVQGITSLTGSGSTYRALIASAVTPVSILYQVNALRVGALQTQVVWTNTGALTTTFELSVFARSI